MSRFFLVDGKLTLLSEALLLGLVLFGFLGIPFFNMPLWLAFIVGLVAIISGAVLMFEGRATAIGLKPFTNDPLGWRKAKESYLKKETEDDSQSNSENSKK